MRKNDAFDAFTRLTKIFIAIFAPDERLPSSATLAVTQMGRTGGSYPMDYYDYWSTCGADKWYTKEDTAKRMRDMKAYLKK